MSSIIEGYNYDIFISYRQKDNKHDGWVTEFVNNLKGELESTFKEEISVYFDVNPHDGLLETYDVGESLKDKLKCLILIPIISRTYCDPNSFAWEHELKAFIKQSSQDQFGLKIKLPNGNVASRFIPVQIHDLYPEDKALFEQETGTVLRAIEFIYKEPGVNKSLTLLDNEKSYRIQINKVANSIDEVVRGIKGVHSIAGKVMGKAENLGVGTKEERGREPAIRTLIKKGSKKWLITTVSIALLIAGIFALYGIIESRKKATDISKLEKSIAVLPFRNDSPDSTNSYFINGLMERITSNLQSIKELRVISRTSVEKYRNIRTKSILDIAEDLGVNYIVEGSGQKLGNSLSITTQLLRAKGEESHLWAKTYDQEIKETKDIFRIQSEIAQSIASQLKAVITPDEKELIKKIPTSNLGAYDLVLRGSEEELIFWNDNFNKQALFRAERYYREALKLDSTLAMAYSHLAAVCIGKHADVSNASLNYLDSSLYYANQALSFDDQLSDAYFIRGDYYFNKLIPDKAVDEYNLAIRYDPNNTQAYLHSGWNYAFIDPVKSPEAINTAVNLSHGSDRANYLRYLGDMYGSFGFPEQARSYYQEALIIAGDTSLYLNKIAQLEFNSGNFEKAFEFMQKVYLRDTTKFENKAWLAFSYYLLNQYSESLKYLMKIQDQLKSIDPFFIELPFNYVGHVYKINGFTKEADFWLEKQKEYCEQRLEQSNIEVYHYGIAAYYAIKGDKNKMYKNLTEFSKLKICDQYSLEALNYPYFGNVSNEPEFQKIINGLKTKYRQSHDRIVRWLEKQGKL